MTAVIADETTPRPGTRAYKGRRARLIAYGQWAPYADPEKVRAHLALLMARGLTPRIIAAMAGVDANCTLRLMAGEHTFGPYQANAEALLAVTFDLDAMPDRALIDAAGTRRRVQALAALGYPLKRQAERLGREVNNFYKVLRKDKVFASTARAVRDLYDEWSMTPPPPSVGATHALAMAARNRWPAPLAWDDDLIDLPDAELAAELARRVALMDADELRRCHDARYRHKERSPLVAAAAREYVRRKKCKESAA